MTGYLSDERKKITTRTFFEMKQRGERISMLTSYDYTMAGIVDSAGVDCILVGDSAANVMAGHATTLPQTVDEMIYHARAVKRAVRHALVICDMPFGSYQVSREDGLRNAIRIMKETGVDAVKIEGDEAVVPVIEGIVRAGIPVMGHLGLTPQSIHRFGGYGVRAKDEEEARRLLADAQALDAAGCFGITLEKVPATLAATVTQRVSCATIGIGAGSETDGQVLVVTDMLGMTQGFRPKFLRTYADLHTVVTDAVARYVADVKQSAFPTADESY